MKQEPQEPLFTLTPEEEQKISEVFTTLTAGGTLSKEARYNLETERGFSPEIIAEMKIFSGGKYLDGIFYNLWSKDEALKDLLLKTGLLQKTICKKPGEYAGEPEYHLTLKLSSPTRKSDKGAEHPRIIIPIFDNEGRTKALYPHKDALKGFGINLYSDYLLTQGTPETVIINESPLKAIATYQILGKKYKHIGLSGISSFADNYFNKLEEKLKANKIKKTIMLFDNEIKNNPEYPNYKEDFWNRYDAEYYAYLMAWKLTKAGIITTIATFPDEWRENGKIDSDGALSQGKTTEDFEYILDNAKGYTDFLKYIKENNSEAEFVLDKKLDKYFFNRKSNIKEEFNHYYIMKCPKGKEGEPPPEPKKIPITNFTMEISKIVDKVNLEENDIERERYIRFTDKSGRKSQEFKITNEELTNIQKLKPYAMSKGDYFIYDLFNTSILTELCQKLSIESTSPEIRKYSGFGKIFEGLWIFADCIIYKGNVIELNKENLFQIGNQAILPPKRHQYIPSILGNNDLSIENIINLFYKSLGYKGILGLCFVTATLFSDSLFNIHNHFSIFDIFGKTGSGKNTFGRWIFACFGIRDEANDISTSTDKGIIRSLSQRINLPFWVDEFRIDLKTEKKTQMLLNVYNRGKSVRAEYSNDEQTRSYNIKGTLMITGQASPNDEALFSRLIKIDLSEWEQKTEIYEEMESKKEHFSKLTLEIIKNEDKINKILLERVKFFVDYFRKRIKHSRTAENYGLYFGSFMACLEGLGIKKENLNFDIGKVIEDIVIHIENFLARKEDKDELKGFWRDINIILSNIEDNEIKTGGTVGYISTDKRKGSVYLAIYDVWAKYEEDCSRRKSNPTFSRTDIVSYIEEEPYYRGEKGGKKRQKRFGKKLKSYLELDYNITVTELLPFLNLEKTEEESDE